MIMSDIEQLCCCTHLTSDHETTAEFSTEALVAHGSPCNRCNADPHKAQRNFYGVYCTGFREWPLMDLPWPGTFAARELGCTCPVGTNLKAQKDKTTPTYAADCRLHEWVCKLGTRTCVHTQDGAAWEHRHDQPHESCEHCTVPQIICGGCGQVWADWRVDPGRAGWRADLPGGALVCGSRAKELLPPQLWKCETCRT